VDLFNEGVDVPVVDTLLLLRPTDSPTLFLQQLGRGLRKSAGKTVCTVLDFVGHHHSEFRFDRRFGALLGESRKEVAEQIQQGFPFLPAGCHMELDAVAAEIVLRNLRESIPSRWTAKVEELQKLARAGGEVSLGRFLDETGLDVDDVYTGGKCWSDLRASAGLPCAPEGPQEAVLRRASGRVLHIDDRVRIDAYRRLLSLETCPDPDTIRTAIAASCACSLVPSPTKPGRTRPRRSPGFHARQDQRPVLSHHRYRDYAVTRDLIHWESQSVTRADSDTGLRYQTHQKLGTSILLFARLRTDDRAFWFLGPASYVSHESEQPMAVIWRLEHPLPGDLFATFAAAVA
jgi:hypothetical protein